MSTITIPKNLIKEDLVIIPRREYEGLLRVAEIKNKGTNTRFNRDLDEAIAEYKAGKFFGPFSVIEEGIKFLKKRKISGK
jgi:hypothetical protein